MDPNSKNQGKNNQNEENPKYIALPKPKHLCGKGRQNFGPEPIERVEVKKNFVLKKNN